MAHGERAERRGHAGKEYWKSRFSPGGETPGRITKDLTHRKERRRSKKVEFDLLHSEEDEE